MREHSFKELIEKLVARDLDVILAVQQLNKFKQKDIQSDLRFAESYIRSKANRGQGERRIRAVLKEHLVDDSTVNIAFAEADMDFFQLAQRVYEKKYANKPFTNWQDKQKRMHFLHYRGYVTEQIQYVIKNAEKNH